MDRADIRELHFITHRDNVLSIVRHGILCHKRMRARPHTSIASAEVQDRRAGRGVPGGLALHDYANLYFDARNPMMYAVRHIQNNHETVVVRVAHEALDLPGVVVTDGNAASSTTHFHDPATELELLDSTYVYALSWNVQDPFEKAERKRRRCAEVLIPGEVPAAMLRGLLVETRNEARMYRSRITTMNVEVNPDVFFG